MTRLLPPRPNLEHLRKEAKALLKAHARGDAQACETLRALHRFAKASDREILAADLALAEARHALAMAYGYKSWKELKKRVDETAPPIRNNPPRRWYHGSPARLESLRTGSTVTPIIELARAFAHRPRKVSINVTENDEENRREVTIEHDGQRDGHLYEVEVGDPAADLKLHPESTMAPGEEMLTTRELKVRMLEELPAAGSAVQEFAEPFHENP